MTESPASDTSPGTDTEPGTAPSEMMVRVTSGSRLHFGLLDTVEPFGGAGVMIDQPTTEVVVRGSDQFRCEANDRQRVEGIAKRIAREIKLPALPKCRIVITRRAPPHCGLGSGTQLAMATAEAICSFIGLRPSTTAIASSLANRGKRSAVGVHGYFAGGLIFEDAEQASQLNPLKQRVELPTDWCVIILRPKHAAETVSGSLERQRFARLSAASRKQSDRLRALVSQHMLPAARAGDFQCFARSIQDYNQLSGWLFEAVQGGPYHGQAVTDVVDWLVERRVPGVGQSSWGPGVFGWLDCQAKVEELVRHLPDHIALVAVARPLNTPRQITRTTIDMA